MIHWLPRAREADIALAPRSFFQRLSAVDPRLHNPEGFIAFLPVAAARLKPLPREADEKECFMQNAVPTVRIIFDGRALEVPEGISVAAAVLGHAHAGSTAVHPVDGSPRAPYCLMGVCFECLMEIDGQADVQSCLVPVREGMIVNRQTWPAENR